MVHLSEFRILGKRSPSHKKVVWMDETLLTNTFLHECTRRGWGVQGVQGVPRLARGFMKYITISYKLARKKEELKKKRIATSKYVAPEVHFSSSTYYTNNEAFFRHLIGKGLKKEF